MLRVLQSVAGSSQSSLELISNNELVATSGSITKLDQPFVVPQSSLHFFGVTYTKADALIEVPILKEGLPDSGAKILLFRPLSILLQDFLGVFILVLFACLSVSAYSSYQVRKAIKKALRPLDQLHEEIRGLSSSQESESSPIVIRELEEIRQTISKAKNDLENAKDLLAEQKAKKLSSESYKRLIHDLHNPVAALKQMIRVVSDPHFDSGTKEEAGSCIPRIADQILNQVIAAKKNLEEEPVSLREMDIRDCISASIQQIEAARGQKLNHLVVSLPSSPVLTAHDPILLKRAIVNLLENGIEAAKERIEISLSKTDLHTKINISDDGPGIDEDKVSLYFQGRGISAKGNRQALGLSSANHIVRTHGGRLIYKRTSLGGAGFEIRLGAV